MALLQRVQVAMSGSPVVGPGVMTFYGIEGGGAMTPAIKSFITTLASAVPTGVTFIVPNSGDVIESTTGVIDSVWNEVNGGTVSSTNTTGYVLGMGARLEWKTSAVVAGHHLRGRTFLVPLGKGCFDANGRVDPGLASSMTTAATTLYGAISGGLQIWSRPKPARQGKHGTLPAQVGANGTVVSVTCPTTPTSLRSRRT